MTYVLQNLIRSSSYGDKYYSRVLSLNLKWFLRYCDNGQTGRTYGRTYGRTTRKHDASGTTFGGGGIKNMFSVLFFRKIGRRGPFLFFIFYFKMARSKWPLGTFSLTVGAIFFQDGRRQFFFLVKIRNRAILAVFFMFFFFQKKKKFKKKIQKKFKKIKIKNKK